MAKKVSGFCPPIGGFQAFAGTVAVFPPLGEFSAPTGCQFAPHTVAPTVIGSVERANTHADRAVGLKFRPIAKAFFAIC